MTNHSLKILVLEDNSFQRAVLVDRLHSLGVVDVYDADEGGKAIALLKKYGAVDIAMCDLEMEGMDGIDFLCHIANTGMVNAVVITSTLALNLRQPVIEFIPLLGMELLGDIGKSFNTVEIAKILAQFQLSKVNTS